MSLPLSSIDNLDHSIHALFKRDRSLFEPKGFGTCIAHFCLNPSKRETSEATFVKIAEFVELDLPWVHGEGR